MRASIVIINYNYARFLRQAIESALAQTYNDTEVVVIDDGSTDNSSEVIRSYGDLIIPVFKNNAGQSSCYSRGLTVCSGDLVLFLDADDYLHPHCLTEAVGSWKEGCVKAHFYLDVVDEDGTPVSTCVVQWEPDRPPQFRQRETRRPKTNVTLDRAIEEVGLPADPDALRTAFYKHHGGKNHAANTAWHRAVEAAELRLVNGKLDRAL